MALLKGFPPAQQIGCTIRLTPRELEYYLLPQDFQFVNCGPCGYVFQVPNMASELRTLDPDTFEPRPLYTRICVPREGKLWVVWGAGKDHSNRIRESAERCVEGLRKIGQQQEFFLKRKLKFQEAAIFSKNRPYKWEPPIHNFAVEGIVRVRQ